MSPVGENVRKYGFNYIPYAIALSRLILYQVTAASFYTMFGSDHGTFRHFVSSSDTVVTTFI
ncbi:MAG: hypothetical protein RMY64_30700 [Nostoc sp. DedQUE08]|uniref:hypothetical protein n=1 Tax=Nostoc sp. DedQUE08 TaxID=3075393 RepID=UPI002AD52F73|nr:hypothetical protein [Nostoc sp. DedQUE08]MDZ8069929.1 hypothetical protein [Nostoc sp. DedQUE08]